VNERKGGGGGGGDRGEFQCTLLLPELPLQEVASLLVVATVLLPFPDYLNQLIRATKIRNAAHLRLIVVAV
jgi:hypothetical protein